MKSKNVNVVTVPSFDTEALLLRVRGVEDNATVVDGGRKGVMETLAAEFGAAALMPASQGGINCRAYKKGTKDETRKEEASRLGMPTGKARQLASIINGINAIRPNVWQEYQRAYFGRAAPKAIEPVALTEEAKAANAAKAKAKEAKVQVDFARAALIVANAEKKGVDEAKANLEEAKANLEEAKANLEEAKAEAVAKVAEGKEVKASESLADLIQRAIEAAEKAGKADVMDILTEALESL
jgi:hypothetical protein